MAMRRITVQLPDGSKPQSTVVDYIPIIGSDDTELETQFRNALVQQLMVNNQSYRDAVWIAKNAKIRIEQLNQTIII